ncbi:hypothetical protein [Streptomyces sp. NPDC055749]
MTGRGVRGVWAVLLAASVATTAVGCSDEDGGGASDAASKAASAASSLASKGSDVVASATAAAQDKLDEFKDGVDAKDDVELGAVGKDGDRTTAKFTVTNGTDSAKSYAVQINFRDKGGNLLDTVVVSVDDVEPDKKKDATARSNRKLDGDVTAEVGTALRH